MADAWPRRRDRVDAVQLVGGRSASSAWHGAGRQASPAAWPLSPGAVQNRGDRSEGEVKSNMFDLVFLKNFN